MSKWLQPAVAACCLTAIGCVGRPSVALTPGTCAGPRTTPFENRIYDYLVSQLGRHARIQVSRRTDAKGARSWVGITRQPILPVLPEDAPEQPANETPGPYRAAWNDFERKNNRPGCLGRTPRFTSERSAEKTSGGIRIFFSRVGVDWRQGRAIVSAAIYGKRCLEHEQIFWLRTQPRIAVEYSEQLFGGCFRCQRWDER